MNNEGLADYHVPETAFGKWFLRTDTWRVHVLERAMQNLDSLMPACNKTYQVVADVGCGYGGSLKKLQHRFSPERLIAMDVDPEMIAAARDAAEREHLVAEFINCSCSEINLEDNTVDLLFCHQTFHHLVLQEKALQEFYRVLKPGGILLFAESTKRYIYSWVIRLLFRHPMHVQKTAGEYLSLIRESGLLVPEESISYPFLWWSREDMGIMENWFGIKPPKHREETLINLVASKPV
jgi:ubiquinone/menaquinone biosynthesis C-methylase UbiE